MNERIEVLRRLQSIDTKLRRLEGDKLYRSYDVQKKLTLIQQKKTDLSKLNEEIKTFQKDIGIKELDLKSMETEIIKLRSQMNQVKTNKLIYMDLGNGKSGTRDFSIGGEQIPADVQANAHYDLKGWAWTLAATYVAVESPAHVMQFLGGARMLKMDPKLTWELTGNVDQIPVIDRSGSREASDTNWDAIVGVKGRANLGAERKWFIPYYLDVGTGESKFTWQAMGGLGYAFDRVDLFAAWRYLDYDMKSGSKIEDLNFSGPAVAVQFRW